MRTVLRTVPARPVCLGRFYPLARPSLSLYSLACVLSLLLFFSAIRHPPCFFPYQGYLSFVPCSSLWVELTLACHSNDLSLWSCWSFTVSGCFLQPLLCRPAFSCFILLVPYASCSFRFLYLALFLVSLVPCSPLPASPAPLGNPAVHQQYCLLLHQ